MNIVQQRYGSSVVTSLPFEKAVEAARAGLKAQGFGVLCEIDVQRTMKEKAGLDFQRYVILGACNPLLAGEALRRQPQLGLLLPCNVTVAEQDGQTIVSAVDAQALLGIVGEESLRSIAAEVNARLAKVLEVLSR